MVAEQENVSQYIDFLVSHIRTFLSDAPLVAVVGDSGTVTLDGWLKEYVHSTEL
jgi:hypothetical protein